MTTTLLLTIGIFALCFLALGVGFWVRGMVLKGSCGGAASVLGEEASCGGCAKKEREICPSDDETGLVNLSQIGNPHKTIKERHEGPSYQV